MTLAEVLQLLREAPAVVLAGLVWYELRQNRAELGAVLVDLAAKMAVLVDREKGRG